MAKVLIVDDEDLVRESMRRYFERKQWEVTLAANGADALSLLLAPGADAFNVILCDVQMPGVSGSDVVERLERELPGSLGRLVLTTGDATAPEVAALAARTGRPVMQKPFELKALGDLAESIAARGGM